MRSILQNQKIAKRSRALPGRPVEQHAPRNNAGAESPVVCPYPHHHSDCRRCSHPQWDPHRLEGNRLVVGLRRDPAADGSRAGRRTDRGRHRRAGARPERRSGLYGPGRRDPLRDCVRLQAGFHPARGLQQPLQSQRHQTGAAPDHPLRDPCADHQDPHPAESGRCWPS